MITASLRMVLSSLRWKPAWTVGLSYPSECDPMHLVQDQLTQQSACAAVDGVTTNTILAVCLPITFIHCSVMQEFSYEFVL